MKTNLSSLKTEVDKLHIPELKTIPIDLVDLTKEVQEDFTKKTDFNSLKTKVDKNKTHNDNLETKVNNNDTTTKASINNLKTKVDGIDVSKYVLKTDYNTKIGNLELKIPSISGLLQVSSFNSKVTELENKIKIPEQKPNISTLATIQSVTAVLNKIPDVSGFLKLSDYTKEITKIKNDYVTNTDLTSRLNSLKDTHVADEIKKVDDKIKKNITDILSNKTSLVQNKSVIDDLERSVHSFYGNQYYNNSWLIFKADYHSFDSVNSRYINYWKFKGIFNGTLDGVANSSSKKPDIHLAGETVFINSNRIYFKQPKVDYNRSAIAIHIVYKLNCRRILSPDYVQLNGLFGNCKLTITPAHKRHSGYTNGVCVFSDAVDEYNETYPGKTYRNMLIYGADTTSSVHANSKTFIV